MMNRVRASVLVWGLFVATGACTGSFTEAGGGQAPAASKPSSGGGLPTGGGAEPGALPGEPPAVVPPSGFTPPAPNASPVSARIWRLTRAQIDLALADLLGDKSRPASALEPEPADSGYANVEAQLTISDTFMDAYSRAIQKILAETIASRLPAVFPDGEAKLGDDAAVKAWVGRFGRRAFRRPLTQAEVDAYFALYGTYKPKLDAKTAVTLVLEAMLQSPHFLFRSELGDGRPDARGRVTLTPHEVAAQLSFYLTNGLPDAELDAAADSGAIVNRAELERHARRLVEGDRAKAVVWDFFFQYLEYNLLEQELNKTGAATNVFDPAKPSLTKETETFVKELLWNDDAAFSKLVGGAFTFVDTPLAKLYGVTDPGAGKWGKVMLDSKDRAGIMTHAALMARFSHAAETAPILRGNFLVNRVLCIDFPPPPDGATDMQAPPDASKTMRQRVTELTQGAGCIGCHAIINQPGFALEHLDQFGRVRRMEGPNPIDTSIKLTGAGDVDGAYANIGELAAQIGASTKAKECLSRQLFRFATGGRERMDDEGAIAEMAAGFSGANGNVKELLLTHVLSERFVTRKAN